MLSIDPFEQIMDIINENEAQFLSSLQRGRRMIERTLQRKETSDNLFPGQFVFKSSHPHHMYCNNSFTNKGV